MKILVIFTLCLISDGGESKEVTGYSGGGVLITCKYDTKYTQNQKYFCKGSASNCSDQIKTGGKNKWINSGRFSLFDETKSAEFRVMIRELTVQDTGTYHCGVDSNAGKNIFTPVELNVKKGFVDASEVTVNAGTRSNIKCRYKDEYKGNIKAFCKIGTDQGCLKRLSIQPHREWAHDGRFSIHDNRTAGFFSVFIREMLTEDTGTYACAVVLPDETEIYTVVKLNVTEDLSFKKSVSTTVRVGGDSTISCKYPEFLRSAPKFICQRPKLAACLYNTTVSESRKNVKTNQLILYDDKEKGILTVNIKHVTEEDSGEYWCGAEVAWIYDHGYKVYFTRIDLTVSGDTGVPVSIVIIVCVSLLVLLIGISFLILILQKRYPETMALSFRRTNGHHGNNPSVLYCQSRLNSDQPEAVYESMDSNINRSDVFYQNLNPNTSQLDPVYQFMNPNTRH